MLDEPSPKVPTFRWWKEQILVADSDLTACHRTCHAVIHPYKLLIARYGSVSTVEFNRVLATRRCSQKLAAQPRLREFVILRLYTLSVAAAAFRLDARSPQHLTGSHHLMLGTFKAYVFEASVAGLKMSLLIRYRISMRGPKTTQILP